MERRVHGSKYASFASKSLVPSFFVEMDIFTVRVELFEKPWIADVQLVRCDSDNWACCTSV
jgi:hypothetical protein